MPTDVLRDCRLYNCCPGHRMPDWSRFVSLETAGCRVTDGSFSAQHPDYSAAFWMVYARTCDGCPEAITESTTRGGIDGLAAELSAISGLPIRERVLS